MNEIKVELLDENGNSLREYLINRGATEANLNAKVVPIIEEGLINKEISTSATAREAIRNMKMEAEKVRSMTFSLRRDINEIRNDYDKTNDAVRKYSEAITQNIIKDPKSIDAVNVFKRTLLATLEVFGEKMMTEAVCCKAIEAASYGAWRSIMGEK